MPQNNRLLAWIEPQAPVNSSPPLSAARRHPAMCLCSSPAEARQWIEHEAKKLGIPIEWVNEAPRR